jgi:hypothetical protein
VDLEGLPGVYMARLVTLESGGYVSTWNVDSPPFVVDSRKSPFVISVASPHDKFKDNFSQASTGECLPQMSESGLPVTAICHREDLQAVSGSLLVGNDDGIQVDT